MFNSNFSPGVLALTIAIGTVAVGMFSGLTVVLITQSTARERVVYVDVPVPPPNEYIAGPCDFVEATRFVAARMPPPAPRGSHRKKRRYPSLNG